MSDDRLGVVLCECNGQIGCHLDLNRLKSDIQRLPSVGYCRIVHNACTPDGIATIHESITKEALKRVLVAGCTPRTMGLHFKQAIESHGLSGDLLELVDIREGCAWVHPGEFHLATAKALDLIRMGAIRLATRSSQEPLSNEVAPAALVLGGGIAGMTAALSLADAGIHVKLVERKAELGGMLRHMYSIRPNGLTADQFLAGKIEAVTNHPDIDVFLDTKITAVSGTVGRYTVSLTSNGVSRIGEKSCEVGAILVATGAHTPQPQSAFNYDGLRVITQFEFEHELWQIENGIASAEHPDRIAMILCAHQHNGHCPHCSGNCFIDALNQADAIKRTFPQAEIIFLFHDLSLPTGEDLMARCQEAQENGVVFMRFPAAHRPIVTDGVVEAIDDLTGKSYRLSCDRIILPVPLVPQPDAGAVAHMLNIDQDASGFFPQICDRLRPEDNCDRGIYICGAAHSPCNWQQAEFQATNAAFRAIRHLRSGQIVRRWSTASADPARCTGCATCVDACPYHAISMHNREGVLDVAMIDPWICKGCGNCAVACPAKAICLPHESDRHLLGQIDEALASNSQDDLQRVLVFGCAWSGHAAAELAGARKLPYPIETRLIQLGCTARFDPLHALWGFLNGADGIFIAACPPGDCHYLNGNRNVQARVHTLHQLLAGFGFDPRRVQLEWIASDKPHLFVEKITNFTKLVRALGQSPIQHARVG